MPTTTQAPRGAELFRHQARMVRQVVGMNLAGVTHEESLAHPSGGGNSINWVLGHLLWVYEGALPLVGQRPVLGRDAVARYARGGAALVEGEEPLPLAELQAAWDQAADRIDQGLAALPDDALDRPAPFSPSNNPEETVGSLIATVLFHQTYHGGQLGVLRRVAGKPGAIR
ncbi:MAG TPA: DinB family protein [Gemmatimonadales bacterium]|nr:DinB family protein [Gemmatimonadales bacterium]